MTIRRAASWQDCLAAAVATLSHSTRTSDAELLRQPPQAAALYHQQLPVSLLSQPSHTLALFPAVQCSPFDAAPYMTRHPWPQPDGLLLLISHAAFAFRLAQPHSFSCVCCCSAHSFVAAPRIRKLPDLGLPTHAFHDLISVQAIQSSGYGETQPITALLSNASSP